MIYPKKDGDYRSGSEVRLVSLLKELRIKYDYEPYYIPYEVKEVRRYLPDFVISGSNIILEVKGWFKGVDRKKHLLLKNSNPNLDIRFVFDNPNNKIKKGSKTTYGDWCTKYGFKFSAANDTATIIEWLNEGRGLSYTNGNDAPKSVKQRKSVISKRSSTSNSRRNKTRDTKRAGRRVTSTA